MTWKSEEWKTWLPYGEAFRFVDEVLELAPPDLIITSTSFAAHKKLVDAHGVAGGPVLPGVLLAEQAAQSAWLLGRRIGWLLPTDAALLGRLNCSFDAPVSARATVEAEVRPTIITTDSAGFRAILRVDGKYVAKVILAVKKYSGHHAYST
ncbi:hypothetical protein [Ensifer sp. BR816]|uniref:hypothetical protein n=1 Tax=Rhizobium sp. (strain BR816) TaxID=1057002 RepID=UPI00036BC964|nr:hypothetical protein [Ensifer sp. BR816]